MITRRRRSIPQTTAAEGCIHRSRSMMAIGPSEGNAASHSRARVSGGAVIPPRSSRRMAVGIASGHQGGGVFGVEVAGLDGRRYVSRESRLWGPHRLRIVAMAAARDFSDRSTA